MSARDSTADLLRRCARRDNQAFQSLYRKSSARLYAIYLAFVTKEKIADDVLQDSFVKTRHRAGSYDSSEGSVLTWMMAIGRHWALDLLRSTQLQIRQEFDSVKDGEHAVNEHGPWALTFQRFILTAQRSTMPSSIAALESDNRDPTLIATASHQPSQMRVKMMD